MDAERRRQEVVRFPIRSADGHVDYAEIQNPRRETIELLVRRLGSVVVGASAEVGRGRARPAEPAAAGRPPKWQNIQAWILSLEAASGYPHTTAELHEHFLGHQLSFVNPKEMPIAKTTGTNHRKARREIERLIGGKWQGEAVGGRNQGGTTKWRLIRE